MICGRWVFCHLPVKHLKNIYLLGSVIGLRWRNSLGLLELLPDSSFGSHSFCLRRLPLRPWLLLLNLPITQPSGICNFIWSFFFPLTFYMILLMALYELLSLTLIISYQVNILTLFWMQFLVQAEFLDLFVVISYGFVFIGYTCI